LCFFRFHPKSGTHKGTERGGEIIRRKGGGRLLVGFSGVRREDGGSRCTGGRLREGWRNSWVGRPAGAGDGIASLVGRVPNRRGGFGSVRFGCLVARGWCLLGYRLGGATVGCPVACGGVVTRRSGYLVFGIEESSGVIEQRPVGCGGAVWQQATAQGRWVRPRARETAWDRHGLRVSALVMSREESKHTP
jgi:hypothetical protein